MTRPQSLTLVSIGGLANRINTLRAASAFASQHPHLLRLNLLWFKDHGLGAPFRELFTLRDTAPNLHIIDASPLHFFLDRPRKRTLWIPLLYQSLRFDDCFYEKHLYARIPFLDWFYSRPDASSLYAVHCSQFFPALSPTHYIAPLPHIQGAIDRQVQALPPHTIGIHIRRTDHTQAIRHSPLHLFIHKMNLELQRNPQTHFFLASDSPDAKQQILSQFPPHTITSPDAIPQRDTQAGIIQALVELYTLAHTSKIYGSHDSTFSALAAEINNVPLEILSTLPLH